ncbi:RNA 3'-terminal phosphate cyclase-like protein [Araneus ventricosus]|uniref:RNA 3'-terminal phosphate cyclase-like protein n=1 Tax=Araneus ventricosus TaxID=182803 RepID=A0A4Y2Q104_ARAVE|nr:RNA 3'-terminal phosphate cyclase-like protein [Araneus ventricosus]
MSLLDESRWKKRGERYATVITDDGGNAAHLRSSMHDREQCCSRRLWTLMSTMHRETLYTSQGGCVDSNNQSLACLFMALGPTDVSKFKTGPLSPYTIQFLRHIEDFLQLRMKLETEKDENLQLGTHKVIVTCVGIGFSNMSRSVS